MGRRTKKFFFHFFPIKKPVFSGDRCCLKAAETSAGNHVPREGRRGNRIPCHATNLKDIYVVKYPANGAEQARVAEKPLQDLCLGLRCLRGDPSLGPQEQMLWAPKTHHDILYWMLGTRQNSPRPLRGALRRAGGARNVPRNRAGKCRDAAGARTVCAAAGARWEEERLLQPPCVVESTLKGVVLDLLQSRVCVNSHFFFPK